LRRRFQINQEDCTITVQALLPTATENILEALPVESITHELQAKRVEKLGKIGAVPEATATDHSSGPASVTDDDSKSFRSFQSGSYLHASQMGESSLTTGDPELPSAAKSKVQLWNDLKINCNWSQAHKCVY
jgi:peroxin-3